MTCKDCVHYGICKDDCESGYLFESENGDFCDDDCEHFKNKADFVEVETLKAWLYEMAINNVGCVLDGDFSDACQEIISRLDGLRKFAQERK